MFEIQGFLNEISESKSNDTTNFVIISHILCKTYGWDYYTLCKQPIPFVLALMEGIKKEAELQEKSLKKK